MLGTWSIVAAFAVSLVAGLAWLYIKKRYNPNPSPTDKSIWIINTQLFMIGMVTIVFAGNLLQSPYIAKIYTDDTQERKIEKLIQNDEHIDEMAQQTKHTSFTYFFLVGVFLMTMANAVNAIQQGKKQKLSEEDSETK